MGFEGMPAPAGALWWWATMVLAAFYEMFGAPGLYGTGGVAFVGLAMVIGSTLIPLAMVSRRPMMDLKGWGKSARYDRMRKRFAAVAAIVGTAAGIFAEGWPLGVLVVLLLYWGWSRFGTHSFRPSAQTDSHI